MNANKMIINMSMMKVDSTTMMSMKKSHVIVSLERKIIAARKTAIKILMKRKKGKFCLQRVRLRRCVHMRDIAAAVIWGSGL